MADKITNPNAVSSGEITIVDGISGTLDMKSCQKIGNVVSVSGRLYNMSNEVANGTFLKIPAGFRPRNTIRASGYMTITNIGQVPMLCIIDTSGNVTFAYSNAQTVTQLGFSATYPI